MATASPAGSLIRRPGEGCIWVAGRGHRDFSSATEAFRVPMGVIDRYEGYLVRLWGGDRVDMVDTDTSENDWHDQLEGKTIHRFEVLQQRIHAEAARRETEYSYMKLEVSADLHK